MLWGAYHFGTNSDGVLQATHFLDTVGDTKDTLLTLDFEHNPTGSSMSLTEARAFVTHINEVTGRFPGFYSGNDIKEALGAGSDPLLAQCWYWLAQYSRTPVVPPAWPTWTFWQYTDGNFGHKPHDVPSVGPCDRDTFNGTEENLKKLWLTLKSVSKFEPIDTLARGEHNGGRMNRGATEYSPSANRSLPPFEHTHKRGHSIVLVLFALGNF